MGGFAFDTSNAEQNFLPGGRKRVALSGSGVCSLSEVNPNLLPNIPMDQISDKSKSDTLAKILVCLQAIWFCAQCISRVAAGLSISLLELNTFAHALFALCAFILWWEKPHDVIEPILIQDPAMYKVCAAMCMRSNKGLRYAARTLDSTRDRSAWAIPVLDLQDASAGQTTRGPFDPLLEVPIRFTKFSDIVPDRTQGITAFNPLGQRQVT